MTPPEYRERLRVPLRWWVQATMLVASLWLALVVAVPSTVAWSVTGVCAVLVAALLVSYGSALVQVSDGELTAGRARIPMRYVAAAEALDKERSRAAAGVEADARAYLLLRPYLSRSVRVGIDDPADPTPYWLISTRHPGRLEAALSGVVAGGSEHTRLDPSITQED